MGGAGLGGGYLPRLLYFNRAAPGADTDIIAVTITNIITGAASPAAYTPTRDCFIAVSVALTTGSVFNMTETYSGTTFTHGLALSVALNAGDLYTWTQIPVSPDITYNFRVETNSVIRRLFIVELQNGVAS